MNTSGYKLIILDEADAMTQAAQNALRRVIEKYTKNVRFCIICNYVGKIIPAIQSRCTRFRFAPLKEEQIRVRLEYVAEAEGITLTDSGRKALMKLSVGDMRRMLNILQVIFNWIILFQACHAAHAVIDENAIYACTGSPLPADMAKIMEILMNSDLTTGYQRI